MNLISKSMHAISVKELRGKMPVIRSELKKGESFLIIYKSKPIAKLLPMDDIQTYEEATDEDLENAALEDLEKDFDEDDCLTEEEVKYYLSLPLPLHKK